MKLNCCCGNIEIEWDTKIFPLLARKCSCDYCTQQDIDYVSDPESWVKFEIFDSTQLRIVRNGINTANFYECINCGLVIVTSEIENVLYSVLNAKVLGIKEYEIDRKVKVFTGESALVRQVRRKNNWCKTLKQT